MKVNFETGLSIALAFTTFGMVLPVSATQNETINVTYPYYGFVEDAENPWASVYDALDETGTVEYSDDYFGVVSQGEHAELRTASYALALAGYENQADGYPNDGTANPKLRNLLEQIGFSDYQYWDESSEEDGHSFGTSIAKKTITVNGESRELVVVAPRNYNYMTEWLSNLNVGAEGDHAGFTEAANLVVSRLSEYIAERNLADYKLWIVGYSRGGAVMDLAAKKINENLDSFGLAAEDFYAYTFGAPRASLTETKYANIHDVKDGNDLLLGYVFPEKWGFYNTGVYEEIHPADLEITTSVIDITDLSNAASALEVLFSNDGLTVEVETMNGKEFMDSWLDFVVENGLTREYFDTKVKPPLSKLMKAYQMRTLDKQSEFLGFITDQEKGGLAMVAGQAFQDLLTGGYGSSLEEALGNFPPYQDIVKVIKGTATEADLAELATYLETYINDYDQYEYLYNEAPVVTEEEFTIIKEAIPELVRVLGPLIVADGKYTTEKYGENRSLYYTYSLIDNATKLVYGHIPESLMPILKTFKTTIDEEEIVVPNSGAMTVQADGVSVVLYETTAIALVGGLVLARRFTHCK